MDAAAKGKQALSGSKYQDAIDHYTQALKSAPTSPDYLIQRSTAYQRAKDYGSALRDANQAVIHAQKRAKREAIIEAQFRRGCALHSLERYADADFVFAVVKRMNEKHKMVSTWIGRNQLSLDKLSADDERRQCDVKETPSEEEVAVIESSPSAEASNKTSTPATSVSAPAAAAPPQQTPREKIRHEWYQNNESVFFTLFAKGVPKDKAQIDIQERSLSISFPLASGSDFEFSLDPLLLPIVPGNSISKIMGTKIEITLAKSTPGQKWAALESNDPAATCTTPGPPSTQPDAIKQAVLTNKGPAYPTSSKSGPKDWDKVVKDARAADSTTDAKGKASLEDDDDYEGGDEANHFFKKLFKDSSPEVQRAMMKSYTESNGTALSTNWEEVGKGKVETAPPDGMEAREWGK